MRQYDPLRDLWTLAMALTCLLPLCASAEATDSPASPETSARLSAIEALGLKSIPGSLPTYYSPHAQARARYLQEFLGGEIAYYSEQFEFAFEPTALAVLDQAQWSKVAGPEPYGMPSVEGSQPAVVVMPASWDGVRWMVVPKRAQVPLALLRRTQAEGKAWQQLKFEGCDGIGTHEIGHALTRQLRIDPKTHWFNEFLASYVGYAYLKAKQPRQVLSNEIFWAVALENSPHPFTRLDDFEARYDELQEKHPANYGWYQVALDQRVIEIYRDYGVGYLKTIRSAIPAGGPAMDSDQLLDTLERISPGWRAWALQMQQGTLRAGYSP